MRNATYYKETRAKNPGAAWARTKLGMAEARFMAKSPTREVVQEGLDLYRTSWAYLKTQSENKTSAFLRTKIYLAEIKYRDAITLLPKTIFDMGLFAQPGIFCVNPGGGVEEDYSQYNFHWAAGNIGDFGSGQWETWITRMRQFNVLPIFWRREYQIADAEHLCATAMVYGLQAVVHNVEREAETTVTPALLGTIVDQYPNLKHAVQTEPWLQNGAGWIELDKRGVVCMPEAYMNADPRWEPNVVRDHANSEGMRMVAPTFGWGIWSDAPYPIEPSEYLSRWPGRAWNVYPIDGRPPDEMIKWKR